MATLERRRCIGHMICNHPGHSAPYPVDSASCIDPHRRPYLHNSPKACSPSHRGTQERSPEGGYAWIVYAYALLQRTSGPNSAKPSPPFSSPAGTRLIQPSSQLEPRLRIGRNRRCCGHHKPWHSRRAEAGSCRDGDALAVLHIGQVSSRCM